jgi:hypothetical protein
MAFSIILKDHPSKDSQIFSQVNKQHLHLMFRQYAVKCPTKVISFSPSITPKEAKNSYYFTDRKLNLIPAQVSGQLVNGRRFRTRWATSFYLSPAVSLAT